MTNQISPRVIAVCVFLGTWDSGSSILGDPYIAKWPDQYGNVKQRSVPRPDIVGKYFSVANKIDTHNQIRQNELALEQLWLTHDPWFRINTTVIGMTVTDAFQLARYGASDTWGFKNMSVKDYALNTSYDLFNWKRSAQPFSDLVSGTSLQQQQHNTSNTSLTRDQAMMCHIIKPTTQRDGSGHLVRRACMMKEPGCDGKPGTKECSHEACLATKKVGNNRFGDTFGVFICENMLCRIKHWENVAALSH